MDNELDYMFCGEMEKDEIIRMISDELTSGAGYNVFFITKKDNETFFGIEVDVPQD